MRHIVLRPQAVLFCGAMLLVGRRVEGQAATSIREAVLGEPGQPTAGCQRRS